MKTLPVLAVIAASFGITSASLADISLDVEAIVPTRCEINGLNRQYDLSDTTEQTLQFDLYCNTEMNISFSSAYGGLLHERRSAEDGSTEEYLRTYQTVLELTNSGFAAEMTSTEMQAGVSINVPGVLFDDVGRLKITLDAPLDDGYAGEYKDKIEITITPSLALVQS